jgi:maleylacetate reductase
MNPFTYDQLPARVVFGAGRLAEVGEEVERLGGQRVMLISDWAAEAPAARVSAQLGARLALAWDEVAQHVPVELAERARQAATVAKIDCVVCIGGGSSTGLAKAIALSHGVPIVAVPTTYAGSEQTTVYGLTGGRRKETGKNAIVQPRAVVYDPELTVGLPPNVTGPSAFNALAHSVESLYAPGHNPITSVLALEGVTAIHDSLPQVMASPGDVEARGTLLYGAYLSGVALGTTSAALHHKICHVLGGRFNLVHADAHSVILPHATAFNESALPTEMGRLAAALGVPGGDPAAALWDLAVASNVPTRLADLMGHDVLLKREDLAGAARAAAEEITDNPRPVTEADLLELLERAYEGVRP